MLLLERVLEPVVLLLAGDLPLRFGVIFFVLVDCLFYNLRLQQLYEHNLWREEHAII